jgi:hypothetical protein
MKKIIYQSIFFITSTLYSQELPRLSPKCELHQTIGLSKTIISYSRPSLNGRNLKDIVPLNDHWRLGANEITTISSNSSFTVDGRDFESGKYSLSIIRRQKFWTLIFNEQNEGWGIYDYDSTKDLKRIDIEIRPTDLKETLNIYWDNINENSATLNICWEKSLISVPFVFPTLELAISNIKFELASTSDWKSFYNSALFMVDHDVQVSEEYINQSIDLNPNEWRSYFLLSKIHLKNLNIKESKATINKAIEIVKKGIKEKKMTQQQLDMLLEFRREL